MGFVDNVNSVANMRSSEAITALLVEQQETNRLLRHLAGIPQPEYEASDRSHRARLWRAKVRTL